MTKEKNKKQEFSKAWPFVEAQAVLNRLRAVNKGQIKPTEKGYVLFETGYGPSGLPHIGTFGEVCRTAMVMHAFKTMCDIPAKMICFSDDMDALRKVPDNIPNPEMLQNQIGQPLTKVPDPFGTHDSFGAHNNDRLQKFLDRFGFDYEFMSATECYTSGKFDDVLIKMLQHHEDIKGAVLPILGKERAATYSPFLPISPTTGNVLQTPILEINPDAGTIIFEDENGEKTETPVTGGHVKAQWRADWALRWCALDVDYEMSGVDLKSSAEISDKILKILGKRKPAGFHYELFLDENGEKISKSKGNGLTMDQWLTYAPEESLAYYMFQRPASGKKLFFDIIPKAVDEYITHVSKFPEQDAKQQMDNPAWYIHNGAIPNSQHTPVSFALLLNLVSASNTEDPKILWGFINQYAPDATPDSAPFLDRLVGYAIQYYKDFVLPHKSYRAAEGREIDSMKALVEKLQNRNPDDDLDTLVFAAAKENGYDKSELRNWFQALYQVLLGQTQGPRFGSFIEVFGVNETIEMIEDALDGKLVKAA